MLRVGLTGSIAVGKSFVSALLAELGCHVVDADLVARQVVEPGGAGLGALVEAFGPEILTADGTLDRALLGKRVFSDERQRTLLNSILHPLIIAEYDKQLQRWTQEDPHGISVVDAALMIESESYRQFDKLIVVHCQPHVQLERLMKRDNLSRAEAEKRIAAQMPQQQKMEHADYLIDTSGGDETAREQTREVHKSLKNLSGN